MKYYGQITRARKDATWKVECEPHVMMRLKRLFGKAAQQARGALFLSDTPENARDLMWFTVRYPLKCDDLVYLKTREMQHKALDADIARILSGDYTPRPLDLALPPREYQTLAGELAFRTRGMILGDDVGLGKQQPVDSLVLTPSGWRHIGDMAIGDDVLGSDGFPTRVKGIYPQGIKPSYRVRFSDGSSVEAGPEHLWTVAYWCGGRRLETMVLTTDDLRLRPKRGTLDLSKTKLAIPMLSAPARFADVVLPLEPYTVGALIANGGLTGSSATLSFHVDDREHIAARVGLGSINVYGGAARGNVLGAMPALRALGLCVHSRDKFIPEIYLRAAPADRLKLLHGLMDGDGSVSATQSRVTFSTTSQRLSRDVCELVEGLGGIASTRSYDRTDEGKPIEFSVRIRMPTWAPPFSSPRKLARYKPGQHAHPKRTVVGVEYVRDVESVCIAVEAEDQLYATEHCILTHNTASAICLLARAETRPALVVTLTHLPRQWRAELAKFTPGLAVHVIRQGTPYDITVEKHGRGTRKVPFPDVIVTSYSKLQGWALELAKVCKSVVFDEVQELRIAEKSDGERTLKYAGAEHVARAATWRMGLSATPVYNYAGEIFNILEILKPGALGSKAEFKREWCGESDNPAKLKVGNPRALGTHLRDAGLMLRRTRAEVGRELPPLTVVPHEIDADLDKINEVASSATELARIILRAGQTSRAEKLHASEELSWRLRQATGIAKAPYVAEFVKILVESGEQVVLFGWHKEVYKIWREKLREYNPVFYTGEESASAKDKAKAAFISGESKIFVMSLRAGAGVDGLQGKCRVVVNGELDWSPSVHEQNTGRVYRDGQKESVTVYYLIADCGSDPMVSDVLGVKSIQADGVRDPNADVIAKGQTDETRVRRLAEDFLRQRGELPKARPPHGPDQASLGGIA